MASELVQIVQPPPQGTDYHVLWKYRKNEIVVLYRMRIESN